MSECVVQRICWNWNGRHFYIEVRYPNITSITLVDILAEAGENRQLCEVDNC